MAFSSAEDVSTILLQVNARIVSEGPLTHTFRPDSFSQVEVRINTAVLVGILLFFCLALIHELFVGAGGKPLLARRDGSNSTLLQLGFLIGWFVPYVTKSLSIPISLDYALAMGESATASGVMIGIMPVGALIGTLAGQRFTNEQDWDQRHARKVFVFCYGLNVCFMPAIALVIQSCIGWNVEAKRMVFWLVVFLIFVANVLGGMIMIPQCTMWNLVTPHDDKTFWSMLTQCSKNCGLIAGPIFFAALSRFVRGSYASDAVSPISMMSWVYMGMFFVQAAELVTVAAILPTQIPDPSPQDMSPQASEDKCNAKDVEPESWSEEAREQIVWNMVYYAYERCFSISAIEVATIMLLEVSYGWSPEFSGASFTVIACGSLFMTCFSALLMSWKLVDEPFIFLMMAGLGAWGAILFFDLHLGAASLLLADVIVYGGASVANGIGEGWACRAATKGTSFDIAMYRKHSTAGTCITRFLGPVVARYLIDFGGRNVYAVVQFFLCLLAARSVYRTVSMVWASRA
ncbi:unnamed protein product [Symbiodinium necroappetens]|uniref:Uncharacterized protein n=1 Tax=Symbiodinium necroappetens TaxID=1628268 RepID=A0A812W6L6_9DINO|nr:unnamed protein product [Symbiodinium necroappetens]